MNPKQLLLRYVFDPAVLWIERRARHLQSLRPIACHDGGVWRNTANIGLTCNFYPDAVLINWGGREQIAIDDSCHIRGELLAFDTGHISIGHHSFVGSGSKIWSLQRIAIGSYVLISHQVEIHDQNYHSLDATVRRKEIHERFDERKRVADTKATSDPVVIEDDAWIGFRSTILKGVTVGRGAVVAACSVVTKDVAPYTLVAGNPARPVRELPRP